jgi:L-lactate permease
MTAQQTNLPVIDSSTTRMNGTLFGSMQEQAAQIQKVSAQLAAASPSRGGLEASKPAPQVINNP